MPENQLPNAMVSSAVAKCKNNAIKGIQSTPPSSRPSINSNNSNHNNNDGMNAFIFPKLFHSFLPEETRRLQQVHAKLGGELPSKRRMKAVSTECGISQAKIRKWFAMQDDMRIHSPITTSCINNSPNIQQLEKGLELERLEIEAAEHELDGIGETNGSIQHLLHSLDQEISY